MAVENDSMAKKSALTSQEIEQLLAGFEPSGLSRRKYCEQQNIRLTTFDYYRHRQRRGWRQTSTKAKLRRVELEPGCRTEEQPGKGFALVLAKGRRIESSWDYSQADLERLIRILEAV